MGHPGSGAPVTVHAWDSFDGFIDGPNAQGLLLAEDAAMKNYLLGLTVPDRTGTSDVGVWFRYPEGERRENYPFITIDFLGLHPSFDRWTSLYNVDPVAEVEFYDVATDVLDHKGLYTPSVSPTLSAQPDSTHGVKVDPFLMHQILYQVTVHSRSAMHDRILLSRFMTDVFPPRPFWIGVDADATWRRCELVDMTPMDTMETTESGSKRIFRKAFTVSMDAEILQSRIEQVYKALVVHLDIYREMTGTHENPDHLAADAHTLAEPITITDTP